MDWINIRLNGLHMGHGLGYFGNHGTGFCRMTQKRLGTSHIVI